MISPGLPLDPLELLISLERPYTLISLTVDPLFQGAQGRARRTARRTRGPENSQRIPP